MRSLRRLAALLALAATAVMPVVALVSSPASAQTGVDVQDVCSVTPGDSTVRINLLVLLDTSGSLRTTDPGNLRSAGTRDALQVIEGLSLRYPDYVNIEVALDTFDTRYSRQEGWYAASEIYSRVGNSIETIASDAGQYTDYGAALTGAWERFATRANDCNLLIWFTDGEHATAADEEGEQRELFQLCSSPEMQALRDHVWVGAIQLREGDPGTSRLRYLYGEESPAVSLNCINPLRGQVYDSFEADRLDTVLSELIGTVTDPDRPPQSEFDECTGGDGSPDRPCTVSFGLDSGIENFRAFTDLTLINREIQNPDSVLVAVQAPDGTSSPSIGALGEIRPREQPGSYVQVNPFGFFARSNYPSDLHIVGHQAAESLTNSTQWQWQWEGEWSLLFFGDTPAAQEDARRAAAAVQVQRDDSPFIDSFGIGDQCNVSGFVVNYPTEEYSDVALRLRVDAGDGEPVYPTRLSLTDEPLPVEEGNRRFAIPGILAELVAWDSTERGGNGTNLRNALTQRDGIELVAVLSQTFQYAGAPEPLAWTREIGRLELTERQAAHLEGLIDGRVVDPLLCLPPSPPGPWLASDLVLGDPQHDWSGASFDVSANRGVLPTTLSLAAEGVELVEDAGALAGVEIDNTEWTCEIPEAATGTSSFTCPEPVIVEVSTEQPLRPTMQLRIPLTITEAPGSAAGLLERLGYGADSAGYGARSEALAEALDRERRPETLVAELGAIIDPNAVWRPSDFELASVPDDAIDDGAVDIESILVSVSPGELPASVRLESLRLVSESDDVSRDVLEADASRWACEIPGSVNGGGRFACAQPIAVDIPPDRDSEMRLVARLCFTQEPEAVSELLERLGVSGAAGGFETLGLIEGDCVGVEPPPHLVVPPPPGSVWEKLLPMLAVLVAVAAAARVLIAWRLRPWQPLDSSEYVVLSFDVGDADGVSAPALEPSQICMDLQQRKSATNIGGLRLRSLWMPLLWGRAPELRASSTSGDCIGPAGYRRHRRRGRAEAVVGPDLARGWVVHDTDHNSRLIVWNLPFDDDEARRARITDAERDAASAWERYRAFAATGAQPPGDSDSGGAADSTEASQMASPAAEAEPALRDPFAADADDRSSDNGPDFNEADPFGRDS